MAATTIERVGRLPGPAPALAGGALAAVGIAVAVAQSTVRSIEAWLSAGLGRGLGLVEAEPLRSAVVFELEGRSVGFTITPGCSVAFLVPFFFVVAAGLVAVGRIHLRRAVTAVTVVTAALFAVNQLRLLIVTASMRGWGFEAGYERSHVLLGTLASTVGVVLAVFLFLFVVTRHRPEPDGG
ncbi:MAG TPA: hypothetical protein VNT56_10365 [Acidimicrobiales bacterium]|nr:hypothetical protein [Acidimicrobiales bacterium]